MKHTGKKFTRDFKERASNKAAGVDGKGCNGGRRKKRWRKRYLPTSPFPHASPGPHNHFSLSISLIWPFISYKKPQSWQSLKKIVKVLKRQEGFLIKVGCSSLENPGLRTPDHNFRKPRGPEKRHRNLPSTPNWGLKAPQTVKNKVSQAKKQKAYK